MEDSFLEGAEMWAGLGVGRRSGAGVDGLAGCGGQLGAQGEYGGAEAKEPGPELGGCVSHGAL